MSFPNFEYFNKSKTNHSTKFIEGTVISVEEISGIYQLCVSIGFGEDKILKSYDKRIIGDTFLVRASVYILGYTTIYDLHWLGDRTLVGPSVKGLKFRNFSLNKPFFGSNRSLISYKPFESKNTRVIFKKHQIGKRFKCFFATDGKSTYFVPMGGLKPHRSRGGGVSLIWFLIDVFENWLKTKDFLLKTPNRNQANQYFYYKSLQLTLYYKCLIRCFKYMTFKDLGFLREYLMVRSDLYYKSILELEAGALEYNTINLLDKNESSISVKSFDLEFIHFYLKSISCTKDIDWLYIFSWFLLTSTNNNMEFSNLESKGGLVLASGTINLDKSKAHFLPVLVGKKFSL